MLLKGSKIGSFCSATAIAIVLPMPAWAICPADLPAAIATIANQPELARARLGVQVETLTGEEILNREGDRFFVPASTLKLLTTAAVLTELGPEHTLQTSILQATTADGRTLITVAGGGDPSFGQAELEAIVDQLALRNFDFIEVLYGDESAFPGTAVNPNWEWEDVQAGYGAPVNALIFNENEIGLNLTPQGLGEPLQVLWDQPEQAASWTIENNSTTVAGGELEFIDVGRDLGQPILRVAGQLAAGSSSEITSIAEPHPGRAFLAQLQRTLRQRDIDVRQTQLSPPPVSHDWQLLTVIESPPLAELLIPANQSSNNLYAEALLKTLGRQQTGATDVTDAGIAIARRTLQALGVDIDGLVMVDGSGLARKNLVTPQAMVDVLQAMAQSPDANVYRNSLAVAGVSGTLRNRWRDTPVEGRLYGKSGAISRNFTLAGYLEPPSYEPLVFSIFINNINARGSIARPIIDDIVLQIAALEPCS